MTDPVRELATLFLKLGVVGFGGPAAHVALMREEVVRRRGWLSDQEFLDLLSATNLIPGPNSTELALHIGHRRAALPGLIVAGICFITPAALMVTLIAWLYVSFGSRPEAGAILYGVKPVIIVIVIQALYSLGRTALKTRSLMVLAAVSATSVLLGAHELVVLLFAGLASMIHRRATLAIDLTPLLLLALTGLSMTSPFRLSLMFLFFLKVGSILFGSGYVLLAFLRADLVERWHWLTEAQLLDAIAVGQITPGPLFTSATFIGYLLGGGPGAVVATIGIFLPAFVFVAASGPWIPRLRRSPAASAFLDGLNVASLALMAVVTWELGRSAMIDPLTLAIAAVSAVLLFRYRTNSGWLVLGGALVGLVPTLIALD